MTRRRLRLRTRIVVTMVAAAVFSAAAGSLAVAVSARTVILEAQQATYFRAFDNAIGELTAPLSRSPDPGELEVYASSSSYPTVLVNLTTGAASDLSAYGAVPEAVRAAVESPPTPVSYLRTDIDGAPSFVVGHRIERDDTDDGRANAPIGVFVTYPLGDQFAQIDRFYQLALIAGSAVAVLALGAGVLTVRRVSRPLVRLERAASDIGTTSGVLREASTGDPDFDAILDALRASASRLDATMAALRRSEEDSRRLVADVAHELRTPLSSMLAVSEIIEDPDKSTVSDTAVAAGILARNTRHLVRLTEEILEMSRNDAGASRIEATEFDATALLSELAVIHRWPSHVVAITDAPMAVRADRSRLSRIITNLVANALRHGEPPVTVTLSAEGNELHVTVTDRGPGVAPEHAPHIFDRFYKAARDRARSTSSGLGLAIVRENARLFGGDASYRRSNGLTIFEVNIASSIED